MKYHHAVVKLQDEDEPALSVVCVDPAHKAGTREHDCPVQDLVSRSGWRAFRFLTGRTKIIFKFEFDFYPSFSDSYITFKGDYNEEEPEDVPAIAQRDDSGH